MKVGWFIIISLLAVWVHVAAEEVVVGVVTDHSGSVFEQEKRDLEVELQRLGAPDFTMRFDASKQVEEDGDMQLETGIKKLQNDPAVTLIVAFGARSARAALVIPHTKPTFIPFLSDPVMLGVPAVDTGSGIVNVNYIAHSVSFEEAFKTYTRIMSIGHAVLVVDAGVPEKFPAFRQRVHELALKQGMMLDIESPDAEGKVLLDKTVQAVFLDTSVGMQAPVLTSLSESANAQGVALFSMGDAPEIGSGLLAAIEIPEGRQRHLRRCALNILAVLRGETAQSQPVTLEAPSVLHIDMAVARTLNVTPPFRVMQHARLLNKDAMQSVPLHLADAAREALKNNLHVIAGKLGVEAGIQGVEEVRSVLLPQLRAELSYTRLNEDNVYVESGFYARESTSGALSLQQLLFSEKALARLDVQKHLQKSLEARQRGLELEVIRQTTTLYLQTLIAKTLLNIRRENESLMRSNLSMAKERVSAGLTDLSDVYHWESQIAVAQQARIQAEAEVDKAFDMLNRVLHRPIDMRYELEDVSLDDPDLLVSDRSLLSLISNERALNALGDFFIREALNDSPEIMVLDAQLSAQHRQYLSERRSYWSPDVVLYGELTHVFDETRSPGLGFGLEDETNWQAGVRLSLPLFEGGARLARTTRADLEQRRIETDRAERSESLEQQIRADLHTLRAGYPAIALAKEAAEAARKSFRLIRDNYAQGNRTMADLLLAQNSALSADFSAANTRYLFLKDLMQLQHDLGRYDFFLDPDKRLELRQQLRQILTDIPVISTSDRKVSHE